MTTELYFDGDPATDSTRRRLERVLKSPRPQPSWGVALVGAGTAWGIWRLFRAFRSRDRSAPSDAPAGRRS